MPDRENVAKDLTDIGSWIVGRVEFGQARNFMNTIDDAVVLLKEQDIVRPKKIKGYNPPMYTLYEYECENCKSPMMNKQPFCMGCGRSVKWNDRQ